MPEQTKPADFIIRLQEEKNDLHGKLHRLNQFIESDKFRELSEKEQIMLKRQRPAMQNYYGALNQRLAFYETGVWPFADVSADKPVTDQEIEQEIQAKGLTAPRITPDHIESVIISEHFFTALNGVDGRYPGMPEAEACPDARALSLLTFCVLVLKNGFTVTGESACASPENFDAELGRKIARRNAVDKIWPLEGYLLKQRLSEQ